MTKSVECIAKLSELELLDYFTELVACDRRTTADLLVAIAEIDERKLWAVHACSSMFTFCMERFHMSEQVTAKRLWAARTARRFPVILEMVARGELHLGAIHLLAKHLTDENHAAVLERAKHKSSRDVERLIAELAPRDDVPSRIRALPGAREVRHSIAGPSTVDVALLEEPSRNEVAPAMVRPSSARPESVSVRKPVVALSPRRYKIEITVDEATHDKLRSLQDLLARSGTGRDPAEIISRAIDVLLERTLTRKAGCTDRAGQDRTEQTCRSAQETPTRREQADAATRENPAPMPPVASAPTAFDMVAARSRTIPVAVRREVWRRDSGRCCYVDAHERRCRETGNIEFHHRIPFASGGLSTAENIELRCAAHNQLQADLDFGRSFMDARRGQRGRKAEECDALHGTAGTADARTFPAECSR